MINIFEYEAKNVIIHCSDGRTYKGKINFCVPAIDMEENEDFLAIDGVGIFANEIKSIDTIDK